MGRVSDSGRCQSRQADPGDDSRRADRPEVVHDAKVFLHPAHRRRCRAVHVQGGPGQQEHGERWAGRDFAAAESLDGRLDRSDPGADAGVVEAISAAHDAGDELLELADARRGVGADGRRKNFPRVLHEAS